MNPKRDIVDTICHASRARGHNPTLGLPFPTMWGVVSTTLGFTPQLTIDIHTPPTPKIKFVGCHQLFWVYTLG
jgi:hypothetical protein